MLSESALKKGIFTFLVSKKKSKKIKKNQKSPFKLHKKLKGIVESKKSQ